MDQPHLIGKAAAPSTPTLFQSSQWGQRHALPEDLLREASRRLGTLALLGSALWALGTALDHVAVRVMSNGNPRAMDSRATDAIAVTSAVLSLALFFYTRRKQRNPQFILDLGLVYMVVTALGLGLIMHWEPVPANWPVSPAISWIGVVVLMVAAIVPTSRTKTLIAGLISVSMNPLGMLIARQRGTWNFGPASNVLLMHYPDYLLVGVAVVIAHVLTRMTRQVAKAREMGSYQLGELLGRGGMGEVYEATHRMLARRAAIKLIRPEMIAKHGEGAVLAMQRFRREAEAAANLRSPHTVELYDFGVTADQTLYFVMELLDGMDLESLVRRHGPLPASRTIYILRQVCESLEEAHARGLVHRDIKPANIHLGTLGLQHDFVKVLDFGLVKSMDAAAAEHLLATDAATTAGTPAYMAPEMALGETIDGRTDIYAVGCVAYYLLTGRLVFEADNLFQMMAMRLRDDPVAPSQRTTAPVPPALDRLVLACVARKPEDRPPTITAVAGALAMIEAMPWGEEQARQWWESHPPERPSIGASPREAAEDVTIVRLEGRAG
ncbi:MAG: serine/threonine-protein kinase [Thermoanaerobaculia bacterium]